MIIIPERKTVLITPPRSGSTALKKYVSEQYEHATIPYRHGEYMMLTHVAGAIEAVEQDDWNVVYMLRDPMQRMKSLWRYMQEVSVERNPRAPVEWIKMQNDDAARPFSDWLINSVELFNHPTHPASGVEVAYYATFFQVPAARKSAAYFLRGCKRFSVCRFGEDADYQKHFGFRFSDMPHENATRYHPCDVTWGCHDFIYNYHHADILLKGTCE